MCRPVPASLSSRASRIRPSGVRRSDSRWRPRSVPPSKSSTCWDSVCRVLPIERWRPGDTRSAWIHRACRPVCTFTGCVPANSRRRSGSPSSTRRGAKRQFGIARSAGGPALLRRLMGAHRMIEKSVVRLLLGTLWLTAGWSAAPHDAEAQGGGAGYFRAENGQILDPDGVPVILRGIGLGGWLVPEGYMLHISAPDGGSPRTIRAQIEDLIGEEDTDAFFELYRANFVAEKDIAAIAEWGYDHVRLPFHYLDFWDPEGQEIREEGFELLDTSLGWCRTHGLYVILDMHAAPGAQNAGNISDSDGMARLWTEPEPYQDWTVEIWREIAVRYADETLIIGYDLLNEPVLPEGVPGNDLRDLYVRIAGAIRE